MQIGVQLCDRLVEALYMADTSGALLFADASGARTLPLRRTREHVDTYLSTDDRVLYMIETSTDPALANARRHLNRITTRRLYKRLLNDSISYDMYGLLFGGEDVDSLTHVRALTISI
jgi:hypothetical protein